MKQRPPWTHVIGDSTGRLDGLCLGRLWRLDTDDGRRLSAGAALIVDAATVVLASTDERARRLGRLQYEEGTGSGPQCLADRRPSRAVPSAESDLRRLERELGITHRLSVLIGDASDDPPAVLTCWSTNGEVDEELATMTAMDVAGLVHQARAMVNNVRRAVSLTDRLGGLADVEAIAVGMLMESNDLSVDDATKLLRRRAVAAGRSVEEEARTVLPTPHPVGRVEH